MKRVCAWCGEDLDGPTSSADSSQPITHGICPSCSEKLLGESGGTPLREFLASMDVPTLLVDGDGRVRTANPDALDMVGKNQDQVADQLGGDVFECVNAKLPGGCGQTELCPACVFRNTVTHTYRTGESQIGVPTTLRVRQEGVTKEIFFNLATEKVGDRVLVQVERAE